MAFWYLIVLSSLHILNIIPYQLYGLQIFFPFCGMSFPFWWFLFAVKKFLIWCHFTCSFFYFVACTLDVISKKPLSRHTSKRFFFSRSSSRSFRVSGLMFKSLINFKLIFNVVQDMGPVSFFYMWISNYPSTIYWKDSFPLSILGFLVKYQLYMLGFIFRLFILFYWSTRLFLCQYYIVLMMTAL